MAFYKHSIHRLDVCDGVDVGLCRADSLHYKFDFGSVAHRFVVGDSAAGITTYRRLDYPADWNDVRFIDGDTGNHEDRMGHQLVKHDVDVACHN